MGEAQCLRVKTEPVRRRSAIEPVTHDGTPERAEMNPDLVGAPRVQRRRDEDPLSLGAHARDIGMRGLALIRSSHPHTTSRPDEAQLARALSRATLGHGEVGPLYIVLTELRGERGHRSRRSSRDQEATGGAIEPMHHPYR